MKSLNRWYTIRNLFSLITVVVAGFAVTGLVTGGLMLWVTPLRAQDEAERIFTVTGVDITNYPEVKVSVYGENLGVNLAELPLSLREDKEQRTPTSQGVTAVGVQTALVLDASRNISDVGNLAPRQPRYRDFIQSVEALVDRGILSAETDWLAAYTTGNNEDQFRALATWTQDHGALVNQVLTYAPDPTTPTNTPLFDLLDFTLNQFEDVGIPPNLNRQIIVFSNGFDANSDLDRTDAIGRAQRMNVRIYAVMVGPANPNRAADAERINNLERIARLTSGRYIFLNSLDALTPVWGDIDRQRLQLVATYRGNKAQPQEIEVTASAPGQPAIVRQVDFPVVGTKPVAIEIREPDAGKTIERKAATFDTPFEEIRPKAIRIRTNFSWPDNHPRAITRVEYTINDDTRVVNEAPFDEFSFPIADLPNGRYTLRVSAFDELGLEGRSEPLALAISIIIPPAPTFTPLPTATFTPQPTATALPTSSPVPTLTAVPTAVPAPVQVQPDYSALQSLLLLMLAVLLLLFIFYRRRKARQAEAEAAIDDSLPQLNMARPNLDWGESTLGNVRSDDMTEIPAGPPFKPKPAAKLVALEKNSHLPSQITLHTGAVVRIGRRADLCDLVLDDKRISRAHAIVTHRDDGFHIQDDGSKGGTYVNQRRLSASDDRVLKPGDMINFHAIAYRFELDGDEHTELPEDPFDLTTPVAKPKLNGKPKQSDEPTEYPNYNEESEDMSVNGKR